MPGMTSIMAGMAFVKITMDNAELKRGVQEAQGQIKRLANTAQAFSNKMLSIGAIAVPPIMMATKAFAAFDDQMRLTAAVSGATGEQFAAMTEQAKKLGRETSFTAAQVAEGMTALGRMGFSPKQIQASIEPMMNLARATGTDLATAAQIAANNLSVFKMNAEQASDVADILTVTANSSAQTLTDLGEALKMAGPHAARAGVSLQDTAAMLGVLANMGIRGSLAGTALGKTFKRIADPAVIDFLRTCGIEVKDLETGDMRNLKDILVDMAKYMNTLNNMERVNFAETVFDARGSLGGGTLAVNIEQIDKMMKKLADCKGAAKQTADEMDKGLGGTLRRLASAAEGISIAIGEIMGKTFGPLLESASAFCNMITDLVKDSTILAGILGYIGAATGVAILVKAVTFLSAGIKSLYAPLAAVNRLVSGSAAKAAAAAAAEQQRAAATEARVAREIAAEKLKTMNELAEVAKQKAAIADKAAAELQALKAKKTANDLEIAESARVIAAKQAETAAIIAEEEKIIAAQEGRRGGGAARTIKAAQARIQAAQSEAAATIAAETEKQAAIEKTNIALTAQISAQNGVAAAAAKGAATATAAAAKAATDYNACAKGAEAAAAAENKLTMAKEIANKKDLARGALLAKTVTMQKFRIAYTRREAAVIMATSMKSMVAAKMTAGGSAIKAAGYYAEAAGAKVAAAASLALNAALNFLAANPVTVALIALGATIAIVRNAVNGESEALKQLADEAKEAAEAMTELREKGDKQRQKHDADYKRLVQLEELANQGKITNEEMKEAAAIAQNLQTAYGDLGIVVDQITKSITGAGAAQERFNKAMQKAAIDQVEAEIMNQQIAIDKLYDSLAGASRAFWSAAVGKDTNTEEYTTLLFQIDSVAKHDKPIKKQIAAEQKLLNAMRERLRLLKEGDKAAVTGSESNAPTSADRFRKTEEARRAAAEELANAEKELARIDEENAKKKMTKLEQEIYQIDKLKARYLELAELKKKDLQAEMRAAEKRMAENQAGKTPEQKKAYQAAYEKHQKAKLELDELDNRTKAAVTHYDQQRKEAHKRDEDSQKRYTGFLSDHENKIQQRERDDKQEKEFNQLVQNRTPEGKNALKEFMDQLSGNLEAAKQRYQQMLEKYQDKSSEGGSDLSSAERAELDNLQREITAGADRLRGYQNRIGDGVQQAQSNHRTMASFDASALMGLFDKTGMAKISQEERIAKATEETAKNTKKMAQTKSAAAATVEVG